MAKRIVQAHFSPVAFGGGRLNLHAHEIPRKEAVLIFVHGLGGAGYGSWGDTLGQVFEPVHDSAVDVAVFDYRSGSRRLAQGSSKFDFRVKQLAEQVSELEQEYASVFLVGHSLGGLIAQDVARLRLESARALASPSALAGLILVASPRAGSRWANPVTAPFIGRDYEMLRPDSSARQRIDDFFDTYVERQDSAAAAPGRMLLPVYATVAGADRLVSGFSAAHGLPMPQRLHLDSNHRNVAKSKGGDDELPRWLNKVVLSRTKVRAQERIERLHSASRQARNPPDNRPTLVTEFWGDELRVDWAELYNEVRHDVTSADVVVRDVRDLSPGEATRVDLLIHVQLAERLLSNTGQGRQRLSALLDRHGQQASLTVGVSPFGAGQERAAEEVGRWLHDQSLLSPAVFVAGASNSPQLQSVIKRWILLVINRDSRRFGRQIGPFSALRSPEFYSGGGLDDPW